MIPLKRKESGDHLRENEKNGVIFFTFPSLDALPFIIHGFSSRIGGVSRNEYSTMNLSLTRSDEPGKVKENFRRLSLAAGFSEEDMVFSNQVHSANVREVTFKDRGSGLMHERDYREVDGLVTNVPGIVLATFHADCVPLYFADPVHEAVGLAHSGWRGTIKDIAANTLDKMKECYATDPEDVIAAIGPSICQDCYEVGTDVAELVNEHYPEKLWPVIYSDGKEEGKYQLNLWEACRQNLLRAGVRPENIFVTDLCTCCNPSVFFSHRASHGKHGNMAAFIGIKN